MDDWWEEDYEEDERRQKEYHEQLERERACTHKFRIYKDSTTNYCVECEKCGWGCLWVNSTITEYIIHLEDRIAKLEKDV